MAKLAILIPSYNEIHNLKKIIKKNYNFLIVDDCSSDGTSSLLKKKKIKFIRNNRNLGYEKSLIKGMKYIINNKFQTLCTLDADFEHPINKIDTLYKFFKKEDLDILVCNRKSQNRFLEKVLSNFFYKKHKIKDPMTGMKFYKISSLKKIIKNSSNKYFLVELVLQGIKNKFKIKNKEIKTKKNLDNSKIGFGIKTQIKIINIFKLFLFS